METIALFGGSFDPPHVGHIAIVEVLKKLAFIDKIIIMPTFLNPFKTQSSASAELRLEWLREIFLDDNKVIVSDYEVNQAKKTPSIESVEYLLKTYKKVYLVIGADSLGSLSKWHRFDELKKKVNFIVASRDTFEIPENYLRLDVKEDISSSQLRKHIDKHKLPKQCAEKIAQFYKDYNAK
jgi:nicotinate-nucleotide adenylyltransferase